MISAPQTRSPRVLAARGPLVVALAALSVLALLAGCGSGASGGGSGSGGFGARADATRTVTDVLGEKVSVPAHPKRVVTLSEPTLDGALALGVTPVGTTSGRGQSTVAGYLPSSARSVPIVGAVAQPDYEAIGKRKPDLILVDGTSINNNPQALAVLRRIAPVVYCGYAGGNWRTTFGYVADALGLAAQGREVGRRYDAAVTAAKPSLGGYAGKTFSIVRWQGTAPALILKELPPGQALTDLGLRRPADQNHNGSGHAEPVSLENLDDIDADYLFFGTLGGSSVGNRSAGGSSGVAAARTALAQATATPGFSSLLAYRDHHLMLVDGSLWNSTGGPLLMQAIVASALKALG